jgi:hypothetical protein
VAHEFTAASYTQEIKKNPAKAGFFMQVRNRNTVNALKTSILAASHLK